MEKISILKNNFYYLKNDNSIKSLIISKNEIETLELKNYVLLLNSKNYYKYKNSNNVIEIIENIDLTKLNNINDLTKIDSFELSNYIKSDINNFSKNLTYIVMKETYDEYKKKNKTIYKINL